MRIVPYVAVDGMPFTTSEADLRLRLGSPHHVVRNSVGLNELDYGDAVYRFQDNGRLEEITKRGRTVHLGTVVLGFAELATFISNSDADHFERAGFIVSPRHGIAFVPSQGPWVTALARHCVPAWKGLA